MNYEQQYLRDCKYILEKGEDIFNSRTNKFCRTVPFIHYTYDVGNKEFPILTTKQVFWKSAIAEIIGYLRGITDASEFEKLGTKTWYANANKTKAWLTNPNRKGENDMGKVYGAVAKDFNGVNLIEKVFNNLKNGIDDRGEIITFWNPADFDKGCLRPCLMQHHFTVINSTLHLTSYQRSCDMGLGFNFNSIQVYFLLELMARLTNNKAGIANHVIVNAHFYEDQLPVVHELLSRKPIECKPEFSFDICGETPWDCTVDAKLIGYQHRGKLEFPFSE